MIHFLHKLNFMVLVISGQTSIILKDSKLQISKSSSDTAMFSCVDCTRGGWEWEKFEIFLGPCQYLLFKSFHLMANTNSLRTLCSWYNLIKMKLISSFIKTHCGKAMELFYYRGYCIWHYLFISGEITI